MELIFDMDFKNDFEYWKKNRLDDEFLQIDYNGKKIRVYDLFTQFVVSEKTATFDKDFYRFFYDNLFKGHALGLGDGYVKALKDIDPLIAESSSERRKTVHNKLLERVQNLNSFYKVKLDEATISQKGYYNGLIHRCKREIGLFYDFNEKESPELSPNNNQSGLPKLKGKQKVLIAIHTGQIMTRKENGNYLYRLYTHYSSRQNRTGVEATEQKLNNKIDLFESVLELLPKNRRSALSAEIQILKSKQTN